MVSQEKQFWSRHGNEVLLWREMLKTSDYMDYLRNQGKSKEEVEVYGKKFDELSKQCRFPSNFPSDCCRFCGARTPVKDRIFCCDYSSIWGYYCMVCPGSDEEIKRKFY